MERNKLVPPIVVTVSRGGLVLCGGSISNILKLPFPPNILKDLNVSDLPTLSSQVKAFVEQNRLKPSDIVMVLNQDVYFEKIMGETMSVEMAQRVQDFLDAVPLSNPSSKVFKVNGKYHAVVINRHLYDSVRLAFESVGFKVKAVVPEIILGQVGVGPKFDAAACRLVLHKMDFIQENSYVSPTPEPDGASIINSNKKLSIGLSVGAIVLALAVTGIFAWQTVQTRNTAIAKIKAKAASESARKAQITPIPTISATVLPQELKVKIVSSSGATQAASIKSDLQILGFTLIENSTDSAATKPSVSFSKKVAETIRVQVVNLIKKTYPEVVIGETSEAKYDLIVILPISTP